MTIKVAIKDGKVGMLMDVDTLRILWHRMNLSESSFVSSYDDDGDYQLVVARLIREGASKDPTFHIWKAMDLAFDNSEETPHD